MFDAHLGHEETDAATGVTLRILSDDLALDPRKEWDHLATMTCWHRKYDLGDPHYWGDPEAFEEEIAATPHFRLPLYLYDHSGLRMNTIGFHCPWDSGQVGWIWVSKADVRKEYGVKRISPVIRKIVMDLMRGEVVEYDQHLSGDVWRFEVEDEDGAHLDGCCGFYGVEYAIESGREMLAHCVEAQRRTRERAREAADLALARGLEANRPDLYGDGAA